MKIARNLFLFLISKCPQQVTSNFPSKQIYTYTKDINKIDVVINFIKKEINNNNQVFWVCPLIEKSKKLDYGKMLAGNVKQEFLLEKEFSVLSGWEGFLKENVGEWIFKSLNNEHAYLFELPD